jgi:hypothetical protein
MLIYTHCWELMNSVGSHGSSSLPFVMKVMVCHFVSDSHEVMTALIVVLPSIVVVEISLQLHRSVFHIVLLHFVGPAYACVCLVFLLCMLMSVIINSVQAMNFLAALLLLLMPEENAFW